MAEVKIAEIVKKPIPGAPPKDPKGRNMSSSEVVNDDGKKFVEATVSGIKVVSDNGDGRGLTRAMATLSGMDSG